MFPTTSSWVFWSTAISGIVTTAYLLFGSTNRKNNKRKDVCPGLENLGNTCFLNSILQAWAACPAVSTWLINVIKNKPAQGNSEYCLATAVSTVLKVLNLQVPGEANPFSPIRVLTALKVRRWIISPNEQDAHELFQALTQTLDEETSHYPSVVSLFDVHALQNPKNCYQPKGSAAIRTGGLLPVLPHKEVEQPFRGLLASQLRCQDCGYRYPVKYDLFDSLSLSIPGGYWGPLSLDKLLFHFICPETVTSVQCSGCTKRDTTAKSSFCKKLTIGKLPQVLCIHIQRTQWLNSNVPVKRFDFISFPDILHMDEYVYTKSGHRSSENKYGLFGGRDATLELFRFGSSQGNMVSSSAPVNLLRTLNFDSHATRNTGLLVDRPAMVFNAEADCNHNSPSLPRQPLDFAYRLAAVIVHLGDVLSGHFVTYRRSPVSDKWLYTSDASVKRVSAVQVMSAEAYMLFYERM